MANKINYQKILDSELEKIKNSGKKPKLFLHACCGPCSSYCLEYLNSYFDIIFYYFNPNITPESEYRYRLSELKRLTEEMPHENKIEFFPAEYDPKEFYRLVKGHENDPERGERCQICMHYRLEKTAIAAKSYGADYFTTTLSISPYKDSQFLNEAGAEISQKYGVPYLFSDFKKKNGYKRSIVLSREYNLYRQDFCGCVFSKMESERKKQAQTVSV